MDPFYMSDFSDSDSDDSSLEPIDEQEIYGECLIQACVILWYRCDTPQRVEVRRWYSRMSK